MSQGTLIVVEGVDGAGKTTQVQMLTVSLETMGLDVITSKEPTNGQWGRKVRESATHGRLSLEEELSLFVADRKEHVENLIGPAMAEGKTVILDRYYLSTIAYQGSRGGNVDAVAASAMGDFPKPDAAILLDIPAELGLFRVNKRDSKANHFESIENLSKVREAFLGMVTPYDLTKIDGTPSPEFVHQSIMRALVDGVLYKKHCAKHWGCDDPFNCVYRMSKTCRWADMAKRLAACQSQRG